MLGICRVGDGLQKERHSGSLRWFPNAHQLTACLWVAVRKNRIEEYGERLQDERIPKRDRLIARVLSPRPVVKSLKYHSHWQKQRLQLLPVQI